MTKLIPSHLKGLRMYLYNVVQPTAAITLALVKKGLLENVGWGHVLTQKGIEVALTLTHEEEQELMGLLTHDHVLFQYGHMSTRFFRIHDTLRHLGLSVQTVNPDDNTIKFTFRCPE